MLYMRSINEVPMDLAKVKKLYYHAFPKNERRTFPELVENRLGNTEVVCFYDTDTFVGMACTLNTPTISHIIYLAIEESFRGHGYGSQALALLRRSKAGKRMLVDIEAPDGQAANAAQRLRRKSFYLRAGYEETPVAYQWRHESYQILSCGGQISEAEYEQFWEDLRFSVSQGQ